MCYPNRSYPLVRRIERAVVEWWIFFAIAAALLACLYGCGHNRPVQPAPTPNILAGSSSVERADAHIQASQEAVKRATPEASPTGKTMLSFADNEQQVARDELVTARHQLAAAVRDVERYRDQFAAKADELKALQCNGWVVWAFRVRAWLYWAVGIWFVLGIVAVVTGIGNPLTGIGWVSKEIVRALPFANVFAWVRDFFVSRSKANGTPTIP